jgi:hypothetical protein
MTKNQMSKVSCQGSFKNHLEKGKNHFHSMSCFSSIFPEEKYFLTGRINYNQSFIKRHREFK